MASPGFRLLAGRAGLHDAARGLPRMRRRGRVRAVGGAGKPVHAGLRGGVRVADDRRQPEDRERFPARGVEDRGPDRPPGRRPAGGRDGLAVRRAARDWRGRDQLPQGPHVHHRRRRPRAAPGDMGARRVRQRRVRPVLQAAHRRAARIHPGSSPATGRSGSTRACTNGARTRSACSTGSTSSRG